MDSIKFNAPTDKYDDFPEFNIPWELEREFLRWYLEPKSQKLSRITFRWKDREGKVYKLKEIDDRYLANIINYLKRHEGKVTPNTETRRKQVIKFLEKEQEKRNVGNAVIEYES